MADDEARIGEDPIPTPGASASEDEHPADSESTGEHAEGAGAIPAPAADDSPGDEESPRRFRLQARSAYPVGFKALFALALATIACIGLYQVHSLAAPAFFALTLVVTVRPIQSGLISRGLPRWLASTIAIFVIILVLALVLGLFTWSMAPLPDLISSYTYRFEALANNVFDFAESRGFGTERLQEEFAKNFSVQSILGAATSVFSSISSVGTALLVIAVCVLFMAMDMGWLASRGSIVDEHDPGIYNALAAFEGRVRQYWLVSTIFGIIVAVFDGIVLQFLGVPMAVAWAMLSFLTNYIPNIGFVIGLIPPALLALVDQGPLTALWVVIAYVALNASIQGIFQPKFTGDAVGLTATTTFISLLFWAVVMGPLGTILAVPLTLFAKAILVDASPETRWLDAFLIPDDEARKKKEEGFYNEAEPAPDTFVDFTAQPARRGKKSRVRLRFEGEEAGS